MRRFHTKSTFKTAFHSSAFKTPTEHTRELTGSIGFHTTPWGGNRRSFCACDGYGNGFQSFKNSSAEILWTDEKESKFTLFFLFAPWKGNTDEQIAFYLMVGWITAVTLTWKCVCVRDGVRNVLRSIQKVVRGRWVLVSECMPLRWGLH